MPATPTIAPLTPVLSAMMCDGIGWFSENDYKRMLLVYDRLFYLVPSRTVPFRDLNGSTNYLEIPAQLAEVGFQFHHYVPDDVTRDLVHKAAQADAQRDSFVSLVKSES